MDKPSSFGKGAVVILGYTCLTIKPVSNKRIFMSSGKLVVERNGKDRLLSDIIME